MAELEIDIKFESLIEALPEVINPVVVSSTVEYNDIKIELISYDDFYRINECHQLFMTCFPEWKKINVNTLLEWFLEEQVRCYALILKGNIIAACTIQSEPEETKAMYLQNLCVMESYRLRGYGTLLLKNIANEEDFIFWSTMKKDINFCLKAGATIYNEDNNVYWFEMYSDDITERNKKYKEAKEKVDLDNKILDALRRR